MSLPKGNTFENNELPRLRQWEVNTFIRKFTTFCGNEAVLRISVTCSLYMFLSRVPVKFLSPVPTTCFYNAPLNKFLSPFSKLCAPKTCPNRFLLPVPVASHCSISLPHLSVRCPSPVPIVCPFFRSPPRVNVPMRLPLPNFRCPAPAVFLLHTHIPLHELSQRHTYMYLCFDLLKSLWGEIAFRLGFTTGVSEWLLRPKRPKNIHGTKNKLRA